MPPPPSVPSAAPSSTASNVFVVPSISPLTRFVDFSLCFPAITSLVSNSPAMQQHPHRETSSLMPGTVMVQVQANDKASPFAAERWRLLRRTLPAKDVSPTLSSEPEPTRMEMDDQMAPASPVKLDAIDESLPLGDLEDVSIVTSLSGQDVPTQ